MSENENFCPFCGMPNQCMAKSKTPCWCNKIAIPAELLSMLPEKTKGKICICQSCIQLFKDNPAVFKDLLS